VRGPLKLAALVALVAAACNGSAFSAGEIDGGVPPDAAPPIPCGRTLPASCPDAAPSYTTQVDSILARRCRSCHAPGGIEQNQPLTSYANVFARRGSVLTQIVRCKMPPADQPQPDAEEVARLLEWLICEAPNN
jgi:hypothetical protein